MSKQVTWFASAAIGLAVLATPALASSPVRPPTVPCEFPDGWSAADASRAENGIPRGINHRCIVDRQGIVRDRSGQPTN